MLLQIKVEMKKYIFIVCFYPLFCYSQTTPNYCYIDFQYKNYELAISQSIGHNYFCPPPAGVKKLAPEFRQQV